MENVLQALKFEDQSKKYFFKTNST